MSTAAPRKHVRRTISETVGRSYGESRNLSSRWHSTCTVGARITESASATDDHRPVGKQLQVSGRSGVDVSGAGKTRYALLDEYNSSHGCRARADARRPHRCFCGTPPRVLPTTVEREPWRSTGEPEWSAVFERHQREPWRSAGEPEWSAVLERHQRRQLAGNRFLAFAGERKSAG